MGWFNHSLRLKLECLWVLYSHTFKAFCQHGLELPINGFAPQIKGVMYTNKPDSHCSFPQWWAALSVKTVYTSCSMLIDNLFSCADCKLLKTTSWVYIVICSTESSEKQLNLRALSRCLVNISKFIYHTGNFNQETIFKLINTLSEESSVTSQFC